MGLDQLGVLTIGTLVPKEGGHTLSLITLLAIPPWSRKPPFLVGSAKIIALGHIPCNSWSSRHSLTVETTDNRLQGTTKAGARLQKQLMCNGLEKAGPDSARVLVHSLKLELWRSPEPVLTNIPSATLSTQEWSTPLGG